MSIWEKLAATVAPLRATTGPPVKRDWSVARMACLLARAEETDAHLHILTAAARLRGTAVRLFHAQHALRMFSGWPLMFRDYAHYVGGASWHIHLRE
jgi:hypothetical protein